MGDLLKDLAAGTTKSAGKAVGSANTAAETVSSGGMNVVGDVAKDAVLDAVEGEAEEFLWNLAQSVVDGTQVLFHLIIDLLLQLSEPQVTGQFIYTMGGRIFFISLPLIVAFAALRIISASVRAQALTGARDALLGAAGSVLGTVALVPLTAVAVRAVDAVANGMIRATLNDGDEFVDEVMAAVVQLGTMVGNLIGGSEISGPVSPWEVPAAGVIATALICITAAGLLLLACLVIGLALVARNMLLYIVIVVGPLCLSGLAWGPTRRWASIWMGWMVALIFTKLAIVVVMGLGVLAVTGTIQSGEVAADPLPGLTTVLSGVLMLILAAFMPIACFALFGWMGEAGVRELQGAADGAQGMLTSTPAAALSASQSAGGRLSSLLDGVGSGKGGDAGLAGGEAGAAVGTTAASGGAATGAVVAAEAASEVKDSGEEAADEVKSNIDSAVSEMTETDSDVSADAPSGSVGDGGEKPYSWEQPAPGEASENRGSGDPAEASAGPTADPSTADVAPEEVPESSVPENSSPPTAQPSLPEPAPDLADTASAPEPPATEETPEGGSDGR